jgi:hypothetical protein
MKGKGNRGIFKGGEREPLKEGYKGDDLRGSKGWDCLSLYCKGLKG